MSDDCDSPRGRASGGRTKPIDRETYERIWSHYKAGKSHSEISKLSGVSESTVMNYINDGAPSRGMEPLKERLAKLTQRMQAKLFDQHSKKKAKYYELADEAYCFAMEAAAYRTRIINRFPFVAEKVKDENGNERENLTPRELSDDDEKHFALMVRTGKELAELMMTWHGVRRDLYIGEESERMLEDMQRFVELGEVTPSLREKVKEIVAKEEGATDK